MQRRVGLFVWMMVAGALSGWAQQGAAPAHNQQERLRAVEKAVELQQYDDALKQIDALRQQSQQGRGSLIEQAYLTHLRAHTLHRLRREDLR